MLTPEEARIVRTLERRRERLKQEGVKLSAELGPIRNRAIQRARQSTPDQKEA